MAYYGITSLKVHNNLKCSNTIANIVSGLELSWQNIHVSGQ